MSFSAVDPIEFMKVMWPHRYKTLYSKQREILYSVEHNDVTIVPAANMTGKDWIAGYIGLSYYIRHPVVRIITTSVSDDHIRVLWGEIDQWIQECRYPILWSKKQQSGCIYQLHRDLRKVINQSTGEQCKKSYLRGKVSEKGEGLAGHHAGHTLAIIDEASGVDDIVFTQLETWAKRILVFGNPLPTTNFFYRMVKEGNVEAPIVATI